jgi:hypothetical protein
VQVSRELLRSHAAMVPQAPGLTPAGSGAWGGGMVVESLKWPPISRLGAPRATWPRLGSGSARLQITTGQFRLTGFVLETAGKGGAEGPFLLLHFGMGGCPAVVHVLGPVPEQVPRERRISAVEIVARFGSPSVAAEWLVKGSRQMPQCSHRARRCQVGQVRAAGQVMPETCRANARYTVVRWPLVSCSRYRHVDDLSMATRATTGRLGS